MDAEAPAGRWIRAAVFGVPAALSFSLSIATLGTHVFWQDSGFFLVGVRDLCVLYPPGFVLYLLLCKAWTLLFFFLDFTRAVHTFSAACAALAAGTIALAARDLLRARSPLLRVAEVDPGRRADWAAGIAGALWASGYTVGSDAIYAKGYALYFLGLAVLLRQMIRALDAEDRRAYTRAAAMIGVVWALHPSSALLAPVLLLFADRARKVLGGRGLLARAALAAALATGPSLLLPLLARRDAPFALGHPTSPGELLPYLIGARFLQAPGTWGLDRSRLLTVAQYFWEEFLGVGVALLAIGAGSAFRANRRVVGLAALWTVPYAVVTILFRIEGQHDSWLVAAAMPAPLLVAAGVERVARRSMPAAAIAGVAGVLWSVAANVPDLNQRSYDLAEAYGRIHLDPLDPGAILVLNDDDALATTVYLQRIRGIREDVLVLSAPFLGEEWYVSRLMPRYPGLRPPQAFRPAGPAEEASPDVLATAAFINANAGGPRPIFVQTRPPAQSLRPDVTLVPAGTLWKVARKGVADVDAAYWRFPIRPEDVLPRFRRKRGLWVRMGAGAMTTRPEAYEERLVHVLARSRVYLADLHMSRGEFAETSSLLESVIRVEPRAGEVPSLLFTLGSALHAQGRDERASEFLERLLSLRSEPWTRAGALACLGEIAAAAGRKEEADRRFREAANVPGLTPGQREAILRGARGGP